MKTNQFFSFSRFYKLLKNDLLINYKQYLFTVIGAFIVGFVILYSSMPHIHFNDEYFSIFGASKYKSIFILSLFGLGAFVGLAFPNLSSKVKISSYLLMPTSIFEKFLSQFLIRIMAGLAIFLLIFWIDAHLARFVSLSQMTDYQTHQHYAEGYKIIEKFDFKMLVYGHTEHNQTGTNVTRIIYNTPFESWTISLVFLSLGFYLFSVRLFFQKLGLVKTVISAVVLFFIGAVLMVGFSHLFYPETKGFDMKLQTYELSSKVNNFGFWIFVMACISILFLLPLGYFKLKEKQV